MRSIAPDQRQSTETKPRNDSDIGTGRNLILAIVNITADKSHSQSNGINLESASIW